MATAAMASRPAPSMTWRASATAPSTSAREMAVTTMPPFGVVDALAR
jgi:hypothetical protein